MNNSKENFLSVVVPRDFFWLVKLKWGYELRDARFFCADLVLTWSTYVKYGWCRIFVVVVHQPQHQSKKRSQSPPRKAFRHSICIPQQKKQTKEKWIVSVLWFVSFSVPSEQWEPLLQSPQMLVLPESFLLHLHRVFTSQPHYNGNVSLWLKFRQWACLVLGPLK